MTHNLTITKMALQLQEEEVPKFDVSFVALGGFHIQGAAFVVFGKHIAKCGGPDILNECHITEQRSLKSFISGKGYKKTKNTHQLLALTMEFLYFQSFLESKETTET